jgi:hypothetical protein
MIAERGNGMDGSIDRTELCPGPRWPAYMRPVRSDRVRSGRARSGERATRRSAWSSRVGSGGIGPEEVHLLERTAHGPSVRYASRPRGRAGPGAAGGARRGKGSDWTGGHHHAACGASVYRVARRVCVRGRSATCT